MLSGFLSPFLLNQFAAQQMDIQRILRFPPNTKSKDMGKNLSNPFAKLPPYRHSQLSFKSFSKEEIKNQAGGDSLPPVGLSRDEDEDALSDQDAGLVVRSRTGVSLILELMT